MKKLTKKQMQKLKGMLNEMNYTLNEPINPTAIPPPVTTTTQSNICKISALYSDND
jgi:hypothetical protein